MGSRTPRFGIHEGLSVPFVFPVKVARAFYIAREPTIPRTSLSHTPDSAHAVRHMYKAAHSPATVGFMEGATTEAGDR